MTMVWETDGKIIGGSSRMLMLAIADNANDHGYAWPGISHLARKTGISERQVMRVVAQCEKIGALSVIRSRNRVNKYQINLEFLVATSGDNMSPSDNMSVGDISGMPGVTPMSPEPSLTVNNTHREADAEKDARAEIVASLGQTVRNHFSPKKEAEFVSTADWLLTQGATPAGVRAFAEWFAEHEKDGAAPWLSNVRNEWTSYTSGKLPSFASRPRTKATGRDEKLAELQRIARKGTRNYKAEIVPALDAAGLAQVVGSMGKWPDIVQMPEDTMRIKFYQAWNTL